MAYFSKSVDLTTLTWILELGKVKWLGNFSKEIHWFIRSTSYTNALRLCGEEFHFGKRFWRSQKYFCFFALALFTTFPYMLLIHTYIYIYIYVCKSQTSPVFKYGYVNTSREKGRAGSSRLEFWVCYITLRMVTKMRILPKI